MPEKAAFPLRGDAMKAERNKTIDFLPEDAPEYLARCLRVTEDVPAAPSAATHFRSRRTCRAALQTC